MPDKPIKFYEDENGCHICTSHQQKKFNGKNIRIHTYVYLTEVRKDLNDIPEGMAVIRTCENTKCINPKHLKLVAKGELGARNSKKRAPNPLDHVVDENGCWICTSHKPTKEGYIRIRINGTYVMAHRLAYEQRYGEIEEGKIVTHKCGNKKCINPEHLTLSTKEEFTKKLRAHDLSYEIDPVTGCHICTSHRPQGSSGYPQIMVDGKKIGVHRYVYETEVYEKKYGEKIPEGLEVCHKCDNRRCINPEHLELGTHDDNMRQMVERGRSLKGSKHGQAKLTEDDVREIRKRLDAGESTYSLAKVYGVSQSLISGIKQGKRWTHVS